MTAQQFIKKYPDSEINDNCLQDIACPQCGYRSQFAISSRCSFVMNDDGEDDHGDIEYDNDSEAQCLQCEFISSLTKFTIEGLDDLLRQTAEQTETPTDEPCPVCFREEDGKWFTPCPSDDCPSYDKAT